MEKRKYKIWHGQIKHLGRDGCRMVWEKWLASERGRRRNDRYGHHQLSLLWSDPQLYYWSSLLSVITSHSGIAHRHIGPTHWRFAQSSLWNVYSNNQTYGVIQIDLYFPRARVINPTDRNVCDARNDRSRWLDRLTLAMITSGWSAPSDKLLISRRPKPIINRLIVFLQSTPLIR